MISVPEWLGDSAVLQRREPLEIKGKVTDGESAGESSGGPTDAAGDTADRRISLLLDGVEAASAVVEGDGRWSLMLPAQEAGGPHGIEIRSAGESRCFTDVLFGDVWVLGGQSNMELWLGRLLGRYPQVLDEATDTGVRFLRIREQTVFDPSDGTDSGAAPGKTAGRGTGRSVRAKTDGWLVTGRDDIVNESGVGYFFARRLREKQPDVPIGFVETAIGGTPIETWIDGTRLRHAGLFPDRDLPYGRPGYAERYLSAWNRAYTDWQRLVDVGDPGVDGNWQDPDFDDSDWPCADPERLGLHNPALRQAGTLWLRTRVDIPEDCQGRPAVLHLGTLVDADTTWANGMQIGQTAYRYPPRDYAIGALPASLQVTVRLRLDGTREGGFMFGEDRRLEVSLPDGGTRSLDLNGPVWRFRRGARVTDAPVQPFLNRVAAACFNGMIAPLAGLRVAGIVWYQGESSATLTPENYAAKMVLLVQSWREVFRAWDRPFVEVQLPNIGFEADGWARVRDEQRRMLCLDDTAMVATYDVGEDNDLHPLDKRTVGQRAADAALALQADPFASASGPVVSHARALDEGIQIFFTGCVGGLIATGPIEVQMRMASGWQSLAARISSPSSLYVPLPADAQPRSGTELRFLWGASPTPCLTDGRGLLASPFEIRLD